jgi:hypothetical protein
MGKNRLTVFRGLFAADMPAWHCTAAAAEQHNQLTGCTSAAEQHTAKLSATTSTTHCKPCLQGYELNQQQPSRDVLPLLQNQMMQLKCCCMNSKLQQLKAHHVQPY